MILKPADTRLHMHALSQEHLSGLNRFQRLSADDTCTVDCGHKMVAEKREVHVYCSLSSRVAI